MTSFKLSSTLRLKFSLLLFYHQFCLQFIMNLIKINKKKRIFLFTVKLHVFLIIVFNLKFYLKIISIRKQTKVHKNYENYSSKSKTKIMFNVLCFTEYEKEKFKIESFFF